MSMRIGTAQPAQRLIDFNIRDSAKGLTKVATEAPPKRSPDAAMAC